MAESTSKSIAIFLPAVSAAIREKPLKPTLSYIKRNMLVLLFVAGLNFARDENPVFFSVRDFMTACVEYRMVAPCIVNIVYHRSAVVVKNSNDAS